jgi:hypothetical protein
MRLAQPTYFIPRTWKVGHLYVSDTKGEFYTLEKLNVINIPVNNIKKHYGNLVAIPFQGKTPVYEDSIILYSHSNKSSNLYLKR